MSPGGRRVDNGWTTGSAVVVFVQLHHPGLLRPVTLVGGVGIAIGKKRIALRSRVGALFCRVGRQYVDVGSALDLEGVRVCRVYGHGRLLAAQLCDLARVHVHHSTDRSSPSRHFTRAEEIIGWSEQPRPAASHNSPLGALSSR